MLLQTLKVCLILINALAATLMLADKLKAKTRGRRIPENVLLGIAVLGGSVGVYLGMYLFRHKTKHPRFFIIIPLILIIQIILVWFLAEIA
jgi:uncharacterized membrane protein YsdA (DUF1294 family)